MPDYPYYPNPSYLDKKKPLAPERIPEANLRALAMAAALARKNNVLPPELADMLLPNALVEGRHDDMGMNNFGYPVTPQRDQRFQQLGLRVGRNTEQPPADAGDQELEEWDRQHPSKFDVFPNVDKAGYTIGSEDPNVMAKVAAAMLAEKAAIYGQDKAVERWNGNGRTVSKNGQVFADSQNHARKVKLMAEMLKHPANAQTMNFYKSLLGE